VSILQGRRSDRELCVDRTPIPVAQQILMGVDNFGVAEDPRILDVGCGEGAWGIAARRIWPDAHITGIDVRDEARKHAAKVYDEFVGTRFQDYEPGGFDLIVGNPPFSTRDNGRPINLFPALIKFAMKHCNQVSGVVCYYGLNDLGQRSIAPRGSFKQYPPSVQMRVSGTISHRGPKTPAIRGSGAADIRCYSGWLWSMEDINDHSASRGWFTCNLPLLSAADRRWETPPGVQVEEEIQEYLSYE